MKYLCLALSLLVFVVACSTHVAPSTQPRPSTQPQEARVSAETRRTAMKSSPAVRSWRARGKTVSPTALANGVLAEVNAVRRRAGVRPLRSDPALTRAATRYAQELAARREIEHVSRTPGRRTFRERIAAEGGRARIAGENLARLTASPEMLPERAVRAWMRSPGHRANMLDGSYARTGIGVWLGRDGVWYIVQEFATAD